MKNLSDRKGQQKSRLFRTLAGGILFALAVGLCSCGEAGREPEPEKDMTPTGILVPRATFQEVRPNVQGMQDGSYCWIGDFIYSAEWEMPEGADFPRFTVYREAVDGSSEREAFDEQDDRLIYALFTDGTGNLGYIAAEHADTEREYFLIRKDGDGRELSRVPLELAEDPTAILEGAMDPEGNALYVTRAGRAYLLDSEGKSLGTADLGMSQPSILNCGEMGIYICQADLSGRGVMPLRKADFAAGTVRELRDIQVEDLLSEELNISALGSEEGILLAGRKTLWRYDPESGEREEILSWLDPEINIEGSGVTAVRYGDILEDGKREMEILLAGWNVAVPEVAKITYIDQVYVSERQSLVAGVAEYSMMEDVVRRFNRSNTRYRVELKHYDTDTMLSDLILNPEEMPDLLDINWIVPDVLVSKDLLEDLEPYYKKSEVVKKDDILPAVWEAGRIDGKEVGAVISFGIQTYWTTIPDFPRDGWGIEDFMDLAQKNPDKNPLATYTPVSVMNLFAATLLDDFVDWEKGKCSFDSPEFIEALERIASLEYPKEEAGSRKVYQEDEAVRKFLKQEFWLKSDYYAAPYYYQQAVQKYGDKAFNVGYPTVGDEPQYLMNINQQLAIYSNSGCKDGAWAFIEFLLSEEEQTWYGDAHPGFPVRKDAFEAYLNRPYSAVRDYAGDTPGEGAEELAYMAEHMRKGDTIRLSEIWDIIWEEVPYLFEGDKDAETVAELIQNRARLYLEENL
ncbi:MAG: ABC transporter substrate-binding protein [Roseburia sp.]|nr:ABC transporter substrate-binding protein [Roseburia sp.]MCM1098428.1 ABC transporter substrate-binding protein [Ruminococcus flavefaciens]